MNRSNIACAWSNLENIVGRIVRPWNRCIGHRPDHLASVLQREVHGVRQRAVGARRPVLSAALGRADEASLTTTGEKRLGIWLDFTGFSDNGGNHVLFDGRRGPEEFTCPAVEGVDDPGLTGDTGEDLPPLAFFHLRFYPTHLAWVRTDRCVNQDAFKGVVDIPMRSEEHTSEL